MQDLDSEPKTAKDWFSRACVEAVLAKAYENQDLAWIAQPHKERAVYAVAMGLKMLAIQSAETLANDERLK